MSISFYGWVGVVPVSYWRVFTDTKSPEASQRLTTKLQSRVGRDFREVVVDEYHKGGHVVTFKIVHEFEQWNICRGRTRSDFYGYLYRRHQNAYLHLPSFRDIK